MLRAVEVLSFWFGKPTDPTYGSARREWFVKNPVFDDLVRSHFLEDYQRAAAGALDDWQAAPETCLALLLLLDQFPRHLFRGDARAYATDAKAVQVAKGAIAKGWDRQVLPVQRWFFYLPLEHSESLADQDLNLHLCNQLPDEPDHQRTLDYAKRHREVIVQFGRFPHRNAILGRESTPAEVAFLQQRGSSF